jgi:poly(3-hydroxyalkanoate) synthetase
MSRKGVSYKSCYSRYGPSSSSPMPCVNPNGAQARNRAPIRSLGVCAGGGRAAAATERMARARFVSFSAPRSFQSWTRSSVEAPVRLQQSVDTEQAFDSMQSAQARALTSSSTQVSFFTATAATTTIVKAAVPRTCPRVQHTTATRIQLEFTNTTTITSAFVFTAHRV